MAFTANTSFANRDMMDLVFVDYATKKPFMNFELANATGYNLDGTNVYAFGGHGHPRRVTFSGDRNASLTISTQMQTMKLYQLITGADVENTVNFLQREELTADATGKVAVAKIPVAGSINVYDAADDCGTALDATASGKDITIDGAAEGDKVVVYYMTALSDVTNLKIKTDSFPKAVTVFGTTYMRTEEDEIIPYKMVAYKAVAQPSFSVDFSNDGDPVSLEITFDLNADADDNILDLIMIEE